MKRPTSPPGARAALAIAHLIQANPGLDELPIRWEVTRAKSVQPQIEHMHPDAQQVIEALAAALELPLDRYLFTTDDGIEQVHLTASGRWASVPWHLSVFAPAPEAGGDR